MLISLSPCSLLDSTAKLLRHAIAVKVAHHDATGEVTHAFYDRLVFSKVQAVLGGRVKIIISGSAPIRPDVLKLLRVCLAADVREGYGQVSTCRSVTSSLRFSSGRADRVPKLFSPLFLLSHFYRPKTLVFV